MERPPPAIIGLLAVNGVFFALTFGMPGLADTMFNLFALFFPQNGRFGPWQFVTSLFMHGSLAHLLFNMLALVMFGSILERIWGLRKFLFFYFFVGIGAGLIYTVVNWIQFTATHSSLIEAGVPAELIRMVLETGRDPPGLGSTRDLIVQLYQLYATPAVGASGAIYGVLVAFGFYFPNAKLSLIFFPVPIAAKYFIPGLVALDLLSGVTGFSLFGGGIAHFAHIGGAVIGFLLMWCWRKQARDRPVVVAP